MLPGLPGGGRDTFGGFPQPFDLSCRHRLLRERRSPRRHVRFDLNRWSAKHGATKTETPLYGTENILSRPFPARLVYYYPKLGRVIFSRDNAFSSEMRVIGVEYDPTEDGYK